MIKYLKVVLVCLLISFVSACVSTDAHKLTVENKVTLVEVPADLMVSIPVPVPPAKDKYLKSTASEKEELLVNYASDLLASLYNANLNLKAIREYQLKMQKIYHIKEKEVTDGN